LYILNPATEDKEFYIPYKEIIAFQTNVIHDYYIWNHKPNTHVEGDVWHAYPLNNKSLLEIQAEVNEKLAQILADRIGEKEAEKVIEECKLGEVITSSKKSKNYVERIEDHQAVIAPYISDEDSPTRTKTEGNRVRSDPQNKQRKRKSDIPKKSFKKSNPSSPRDREEKTKELNSNLLFVQSNPPASPNKVPKKKTEHERAHSTPSSPEKVVANTSPNREKEKPNSGNSTSPLSSSPRKKNSAVQRVLSKELEELSTTSSQEIDVVGLETESS